MTAKIILWIVIIAGVAAGGAALIQHTEKEPTELSQEATGEELQQSSGKKMAFSAFLQSDKGSYRCTVDQYLNDMDSDGVVYLEGGKIRGDFTTIAEGKPIATSFVIKDGYQYVWSDAAPVGMKMAVEAGATGSAAAQAQGVYSWDAEQIGAYDCQPWLTRENHEARFALPSGVSFTDLSVLMKGR